MKPGGPLKRRTPMKRKTRIRPRSKRNSYRKRERDLPYLLWIRGAGVCVACFKFSPGPRWRNWCDGPIEAAHRDVGGKAMSNKTPDREALPLCRGCHRAPGLHRWERWQQMTKPERRDWWMAAVAVYQAEYAAQLAKEAA